MKLVYISGPYSSPSRNSAEVDLNIAKAKLVALKYWKLGYAVICPHMNTAHMDGQITWQEFMEGDLEILKRCDMIVMLPGYERSVGSRIELHYAQAHPAIEIVYEKQETP